MHGFEQALFRFAQAAQLTGCQEPKVDWHRWEHADLVQAEALRSAAIAGHLHQWLREFGPPRDGAYALSVLSQATGGELQGDVVRYSDRTPLSGLLSAGAGDAPDAPACAWLAWLLWQSGLAQVAATVDGTGWNVRSATAEALRPDWLADAIESIARS